MAFDQRLAEYECRRLMALPIVYICEQFISFDVLDRIDADGVDAHVQIHFNRAVDIIFHVLIAGSQIYRIAGHVLGLKSIRVFPVAAGDKSVEVVPFRIERHRVRSKEPVGIVVGIRHANAGFWIDERDLAVGVGILPFAEPLGRGGIVVVLAELRFIVAEVLFVRRAEGYSGFSEIFNGKPVYEDFSADAVVG